MPSLRKKAWLGCRVILVLLIPVVILLVAARPIGAMKDQLPASVGVYGDLIVGFGILAVMSFAVQRWTRCAQTLRWLPFAYAGIMVFGQVAAADAYTRYQRFMNEEPALRFQLTHGAVDILLVHPPASEIRIVRPAPEVPASPTDASGWNVRFSVASASADKLRLHLVRRSRQAAVSALSGSLGPLARRSARGPDWLIGWSGWRPRATHAVVLNVDGIQLRTQRKSKLRPPDWEAMIGGSTLTPPVYAILLEASDARLQEWKTWAEETGGDAIRFKDAGRPLLVDAALRLATEQSADFAYPALARRYRPMLRFDSDEQYPNPLDVENFLASPEVQVCGKVGGADLCGALAGWTAADPLREYLSFSPKAFRGKSAPSAIYYHVVAKPEDDRVYLDYWWYFAYNTTPIGQSVLCQTGFNATGLTCFDHISDWEGITVVLRKEGGDLAPEGAIYAQHEFGVAYAWRDLQKQRALVGDRPVVFVAKGSHASYPTPCLRKCAQIHDPSYRKEGRHDGKDPWPKNEEGACMNSCLKRLPQTRNGLPALWNASPRLWGKRFCAFGTSSCDGVEAPRAPGFQGRFGAPWKPLVVDREIPDSITFRSSPYG